jgi:hypothetical protein
MCLKYVVIKKVVVHRHFDEAMQLASDDATRFHRL